MKHKKSNKIWKSSLDVFPGGVNSPVRAYSSIKRRPVALKRGKGAYVTDEDDNVYLDFLNSWGPLILGHSNKEVVQAVRKQANNGTSLGSVSKRELQLGQYVLKHVGHVERLRFTNSGTESVMTAIRLARAYTERTRIIKFEGCYHGHYDDTLVQAGSGMLTATENITEASSPGVVPETSQHTIVLPLDEPEKLEQIFEQHGEEIAAIVIEPLPANSGLLPQRLRFLRTLRDISYRYGSLLIFDEVITGFRLSMGGFAGKYYLEPDLVTYGKVIGGGMPVGAVAGTAEIMDMLAPAGPVYQAGTLAGNPLAMVCGLETLKLLHKEELHTRLEELGEYLDKEFTKEIVPLFQQADYQIKLEREGSIFWFSIQPPGEAQTIRKIHEVWSEAPRIYDEIFRELLEQGVHMAPSAFEVAFLSSPMRKKDIDFFIRALSKAVKKTTASRVSQGDHGLPTEEAVFED